MFPPARLGLCQSQTLAETKQQGVLHQVASNAKRSHFSGRGNTQLFTSNDAMPVAVDQQGACKETDSALNFGHQSKGTNAIA